MRAAARLRRSALPARLRELLSAMAAERLVIWEPFRQAKVVMAFASFSDEIDTLPLLKRILDLDKGLVLPVTVTSQRDLELRRVGNLTALAPGRWGIPEPGPQSPVVQPAEIQLVVVPGLAFDERGHRTGYGGGYYDRLLRTMRSCAANDGRRPLACGLGYEVQVVKQVPTGPGDEPLDALVTDAALREYGGGKTGFGRGTSHS